MIEKYGYEQLEFKIEITEKGIKPLGSKKFFGLSKDGFKINILKCEAEILYIGITRAYLSNRLSRDLNATIKSGHNGYHGFRWIKSNEGKDLDLVVLSFPNLRTKEDREIVETIIAELVFRIRERFNKWPECQHEIHFYNNAKEIVDFAENLFRELIREKRPPLTEIAAASYN